MDRRSKQRGQILSLGVAEETVDRLERLAMRDPLLYAHMSLWQDKPPTADAIAVALADMAESAVRTREQAVEALSVLPPRMIVTLKDQEDDDSI